MKRTWMWFGVLVAGTIVLAACAKLIGKPMTPEQRKCYTEQSASMPDLTGAWETEKAELLDVRHAPSNREQINISISASTSKQPEWQPAVARLVRPGLVQETPPACGTEWQVATDRDYPQRKAQPGQFISQRDRDTATLSADGNQLTFDTGEVWKRVGAVGALQVPRAGEAANDMEITGVTLETFEEPNANSCFAACDKNEKCAAAVLFERTCTLKSTLGEIRERGHASMRINPNFDPRPPPEVPAAGGRLAGARLIGTVLRRISIPTARPYSSSERQCSLECTADWNCQAFSAQVESPSCELFGSVTGAKRDAAWMSSVQAPRVALVPAEGAWTYDSKLSGKTIASMPIRSREECAAACEANPKCVGISSRWISAGPKNPTGAPGECELKSELGTASPAEHWASWAVPPKPASPSDPPDQTMTSPLCQNHGASFPARIFHADRDKGQQWNSWIDVAGLVEGKPPTAVYRAEGPAISWTKAFYVRPLPNGEVHFHVWYKADLVLKRSNGDIVIGPVDEHSNWRLENLWEHIDDPQMQYGSIVIRSPEDGTFLTAVGSGLELRGNPDDVHSHWHPSWLTLPSEAGRPHIPLSVIEPPPIPLDPRVVNALVDWAMAEYAREQPASCWKKRLKDSCPASGQSTNCGAMCARDTATCITEAADMAISVSDVALSIGGAIFTGGSANVALRAARAGGQGAKAAMRQAMKSAGRALQKKVSQKVSTRIFKFVATRGKSEGAKVLAKAVAKDMAIRTGKLTAKQAMGSAAEEYLKKEEMNLQNIIAQAYVDEVSRIVAERIALAAAAGNDPDLLAIAAAIDPTGISAAVNSFVKPMCGETPLPNLDF